MRPEVSRVRFPTGPVLALDTGSPQVSVAVAADGLVLASRSLPQTKSSRELLPAIDEVLERSGLTLRDLGGLLALAGPGSFTGLRVGLATALGLHQATGAPASTLPTLEVLAAAGARENPDREIISAIDARRGEWVIQSFEGDPTEPSGPSRRIQAEDLLRIADDAGPETGEKGILVIGFGIRELFGTKPLKEGIPSRVTASEPPPLAAIAAAQAFRRELAWDAARLTAPIYFRPPAVTVAAPRATKEGKPRPAKRR